MFDSKREMIFSLISGKNITNNINGVSDDEVDYITYITPIGWISGKLFDVNEIDASSEETIKEELYKLHEQNKGVDAFSLSASLYNKSYKNAKESEEQIEGSSRAIFLEDVTIKNNSNNIQKINVFVLFSDQVIGVLPGRMDF